jgi:hypothetical protein
MVMCQWLLNMSGGEGLKVIFGPSADSSAVVQRHKIMFYSSHSFVVCFYFQQISLRLTYKLLWPEPRMILNSSADWSEGEINVRGDMVEHFWTPDIIIHDLVSFYKPEVLNEVAALEIKKDKRLYYKVRWEKIILYIVVREIGPTVTC